VFVEVDVTVGVFVAPSEVGVTVGDDVFIGVSVVS